MTEYINMDSFGQDCPANWETIADYLNAQIDALSDITDPDTGDITPDGREAIDAIWTAYWDAYHSGTLPADAPAPII